MNTKRLVFVNFLIALLLVYSIPAFSKNILDTWRRLEVWEKLVSIDKRFELVLQSDGNLVLYKEPEHNPLWVSNTVGNNASYAVMQSDGNFVLYQDDGKAIWSTGSVSPLGKYILIMQHDGNLVIYENDPKGKFFWSTGTVGSPDDSGPPDDQLLDFCCVITKGDALLREDTIGARNHAAAQAKCIHIMRTETIGNTASATRGACD